MSFENLSKICRTCLLESYNMKSIFGLEQIMEFTSPLADILMNCASVQIFKGDGLPELICYNCVQELSRSFLFIKLCEKSDVTLRSYFAETLPLDIEVKTLKIREDSQENCDSLQEKLESKEYILEDGFPSKDLQDIDENSCGAENGNSSNSDNESSDYIVKADKAPTNENIPNNIKKEYKCDTCQETYLNVEMYHRHINEEHKSIRKRSSSKRISTKPPQWKEEIYKDPKRLSETKKKKVKTGISKQRNLPRTCDICNKTFRFHSNLERHKLIHSGEKPFLCNVCGKAFAQMSYLKIHSFIHTGEKPYQCQVCDKSFSAPGTLMTHVRTHTGERPHICKICGKDFPQSGTLSGHMRTHTGEKPVECKVCHRRFNQSGRLIIHMRIHSGEKPYQCTDCGRSFAVKSTLKKHIRTHTGERPYICSICGQAFAQSGTLTTHMKIHARK